MVSNSYSYDEYISGFLLFFALLLIIIIIIAEYISHDCIPGKQCSHAVTLPDPNADYSEFIDGIQQMVRVNTFFAFWRLALLAGLVVSV